MGGSHNHTLLIPHQLPVNGEWGEDSPRFSHRRRGSLVGDMVRTNRGECLREGYPHHRRRRITLRGGTYMGRIRTSNKGLEEWCREVFARVVCYPVHQLQKVQVLLTVLNFHVVIVTRPCGCFIGPCFFAVATYSLHKPMLLQQLRIVTVHGGYPPSPVRIGLSKCGCRVWECV